jgi:hypothetical protein
MVITTIAMVVCTVNLGFVIGERLAYLIWFPPVTDARTSWPAALHQSAISTGSPSRSAMAKVVRPTPSDVSKDGGPAPDEQASTAKVVGPPSGRCWSCAQNPRRSDHAKLLHRTVHGRGSWVSADDLADAVLPPVKGWRSDHQSCRAPR